MRSTGRVGFLFACYFAPAGAPIYSRTGEDPFATLTEHILKVEEQGPVWVFGDFNSRIKDTQGENNLLSADSSWRRQVEDSSTIDFLLANATGRNMVLQFQLGALNPESDHCSLRCVLAGFEYKCRKAREMGPMILRGPEKSKKGEYERILASRLPTVGRDAVSISQVLVQTVKEIFGPGRELDKVWYDAECHRARVQAMASSLTDREGAFRMYRNFIKAKKRI
ncbi:hypothetical protein R1sor_027198 [Riccia sorocarpa]|uniref:Endonuclease/exonuclease/phosphatase domain-containing protein n=1 Tax=Riccia sorocarpa TaxID=122646 RepID=A0ABD3GDJ3_9MARC